MKVSWGKIVIRDGGGTTMSPLIIIDVWTEQGQQSWAYLTPRQAEKIAAQLIRLSVKKRK